MIDNQVKKDMPILKDALTAWLSSRESHEKGIEAAEAAWFRRTGQLRLSRESFEDAMKAYLEASNQVLVPQAASKTKCGICGGSHDNDALTDICTSCEARINEEGSP